MATLDKGTPIGVSDLNVNNVLDKGTPIGVKENSSEESEEKDESDDAARESE